jgi:hypothetical protein
MTKYDPYTDIKLLTNLTGQTFKISNINHGKLYFLNWKYALLTINNNIYITYSKVIIEQLKSSNFINEQAVLKVVESYDQPKKYHVLWKV